MEHIIVEVNADIDTTGFVTPRSILWKDGRVFKIDEVRSFRPASTISKSLPGDCYTVVINGKTRHLFFEHGSKMFPIQFGRWYVTV